MMSSKFSNTLQIYFLNSSDILIQKDTQVFQFYSDFGGWKGKKDGKNERRKNRKANSTQKIPDSY